MTSRGKLLAFERQCKHEMKLLAGERDGLQEVVDQLERRNSGLSVALIAMSLMALVSMGLMAIEIFKGDKTKAELNKCVEARNQPW